MLSVSGIVTYMLRSSLIPRPLPSFLLFAVRKSGRGPGTFNHVYTHAHHVPHAEHVASSIGQSRWRWGVLRLSCSWVSEQSKSLGCWCTSHHCYLVFNLQTGTRLTNLLGVQTGIPFLLMTSTPHGKIRWSVFEWMPSSTSSSTSVT